MKRRAGLVVAALAALVVIAACGGNAARSSAPDPSDGLRIAAFDFAESELLAELYAQTLEARDVPVLRLGAVGPREIVAPALEGDAVDLVPEYAGTAVQFAGGAVDGGDAQAAAAALNELLAPRGLRVLTPSPAVDTNVFVVSAAAADRHGLRAVSDLAGVGFERFGGPAECPDRALCLLGLRETYGVTFAEFVTQPSLAFTAEALRRGEIDVGLLFSTAPELDSDDLVALRDDRALQPADNVVPVIRAEALERWGSGVPEGLDTLSARLTTEELRRLNRRVADGEGIAAVAADWLGQVGLTE